MRYIKKLLLISGLAVGGLIASCGVETDLDMRTANHIARPAFMVERTIDAGGFELNAWERMHERGKPAHIYIGDDGVPPDYRGDDPTETVGFSPTPDNPVALHLASRDLAVNLGVLARPCQYIKFPEEKGCDPAYWQSRKFTPEVMDAYQAALNDMAARWDIPAFHLIGYGGGANIAAVLAATRADILSLRTVAGNLNPHYVAKYHNAPVALADNTVSAMHFAAKLAQVPQHHFIGAYDEVIPPAVYHSYRQALGASDCVQYSVVQDATHDRGWVENWPNLLKLQPQCAMVHQDLPPLPPMPDFPGNFNK